MLFNLFVCFKILQRSLLDLPKSWTSIQESTAGSMQSLKEPRRNISFRELIWTNKNKVSIVAMGFVHEKELEHMKWH